MQNIGSLTTFATDNFTNNFIDIKSKDDFDIFTKSNIQDYVTIGGGSNLLFAKSQYDDKLIVRDILPGVEVLGEVLFKVSGGENLTKFCIFLNKEHNINALNHLFGLPGTVGGAVMGNAGCFGVEIGNFVKQVNYFDENKNYVESKDYKCTYRDSNLKGRNILLESIILQLPLDRDDSIECGQTYMARRSKNQEYGKTCGSYFKNTIINSKQDGSQIIIDKLKAKDNPENPFFTVEKLQSDKLVIPTGWMSDKLGLRGYEHNGVFVSQKHANFIMNKNNTDPKNILGLAEIIKEKIYNEFGVNIEEEVRIVY